MATGAPLPVFYVGELPPVHADAGMLRQLINRLVSHAVKSTPPAQTPRIEITAETADTGLVHVHVADRGTGIPAGDHDTAFTDVHRTAPGSAGLDLAICRRIVERHGGTITATHNPGGGTRITFTLSAAHAVPAEPPLAPAINVIRPAADTTGR